MKTNDVEKKSIGKNAFYNIVKTFSTIIFPLITFPYASRILHAENLGKVNFGNSFISYFMLIATLGINAYAVRECSKVKYDKVKLSKIASQIFSINIVTTFISYTLLILALIFIPAIYDYKALIVIQSMTIIFGVCGADWINNVMEDFKYITIRTFIFQIASLIALVLFVKSSEHYLRYAAITVVSSSGSNIVNMFYREKFCKIRFTFKLDLKKHLPPILLLFGMLIAQSILHNLDVTMIGLIKSDKEVGLYSAAMRITTLVTQVVTSIAWVVMPQLSYNYSKNNYDDNKDLLKTALNFSMTLGLPCIVGIFFLAPEIIAIIAGKEYLDAVSCCRILTINMGLCFLSNIYGNMILLPANKEKYFFIACLVSALINIVSNYLVIPYYGINGAAIATVISQFVIVIITKFCADKCIKLEKLFSIFKAPIFGCVGISVFCFLGKVIITNLYVRFIVIVIVSIIFYFGLLIILKNSLVISFIKTMKNKLHIKG